MKNLLIISKVSLVIQLRLLELFAEGVLNRSRQECDIYADTQLDLAAQLLEISVSL